MFLDRFNILVLEINFKKIYYFDILSNKKAIFTTLLNKHFSIYVPNKKSNVQSKKLCFFNVKFETLWYIYFMLPIKKIIFSM